MNSLVFVCVRLDCAGFKEGYGNVVIYFKDGLTFRIRDEIDTRGRDCLWIEFIQNKCKSTIICYNYRAPDVDLEDFTSSLRCCIPATSFEKSDVIMGHLNVNTMLNSKQPKRNKQLLCNFMHKFDLTQLIKEPTRISDTTWSLIDLIMVNK